MLKEFKDFIMRGNVLELAVAVIIAGAFGLIVKSFTSDILLPPIGLALGDVDFTALELVLQPEVLNAAGEVLEEKVAIRYGQFIQTILDFVIIAFVIFMIVRTYNNMKKKEEEAPAPAEPPKPTAEELLTDIRELLKGNTST